MPMKKNKSEAGNQSVIAIILKAVICGAAVLVVVYFVGLLILLWGLSKFSSRYNTKEEFQKQCKTELESWFAEREPDAVWDGTFSMVQYQHGYALAAEGTYKRGGKTVDFLCVPTGDLRTDSATRIYVSELREEQEKEICERLFSGFPFAYQAERLYAAHAILIPAEYERSNNYCFITEFSVSEEDPQSAESHFERKLLWDQLDGESLDTPVPRAIVQDLEEQTRDPELEFRRFERKAYMTSTWQENLGLEITMPEDNPAEHVERLVGWMAAAKICEAVIHGKDAETLTITKSYILKADGATDVSGQAWVEHWTVTFGNPEAESKEAANPLHFDTLIRPIEARIDDNGICRVYYTDDGNELDYYGFPEPGGRPGREGQQVVMGVFLGVEDYGLAWTTKENALNFRYHFLVNGQEESYAVPRKPGFGNVLEFALQNKLKVGYVYRIVKNGYVVSDVQESAAEKAGYEYQPPVTGTPGEKTVLNFVKTALMPVGTTLYVYGGGWDWYDEGAGPQTRRIGVAPEWVRFFREQTVDYTFRDVDDDVNKRDPKTSYYPFGGFNQYYYAGLDCSGFVGWTLYNTFETKDGRDGYVCSSTKMARSLADAGYGEITQNLSAPTSDNRVRIKPGDVVSIKGHVWISLGTCEDGSVVIVHSTNGFVSRTGQPGGGVAIGAIGTSTDCEAYRLAERYMRKYFPQWDERYTVALSNPETYFNLEGDVAGWFSWNPESAEGLTDEEHVQDMTPAEVLRLCFGE